MSYTTDLGNAYIIDDRVAGELATQVNDGQFAAGYVERDYSKYGFGYYAPKFSSPKIPRSKWDDLIKLQEDNQSSPWHTFLGNGAPILNQGNKGYCWMYGAGACIQNRYAAQGIDIPKLSMTYTAALGKNFRDQGGWAGEALGYIDRFGIPTQDVCPEGSMDRNLFGREEVKLSAGMHGHVEFLELPSNDFDSMCSVLLDPYNPRPVTMGLMWWGHLVAGFRVVKIDSRNYGIQGPNSWGDNWGDKGTFVLTEKKATAYESIAVERVKPRTTAEAKAWYESLAS